MDFTQQIDNDIKADEERVGGRGPAESGVYLYGVTMAYMDKSKGGANCLKLSLKCDKTGHQFSETFWVTNKKGETFYIATKEDNAKKYLPGYQMADKLCFLLLGKTLMEAGKEVEARVIDVYDPLKKKVVSKEMPQVFTQLIGKEILTAVIKIKQNKRVKNAAGEYVNGPDVIEINEVFQFFNPANGMTITEIRDKKGVPEYLQEWKDKWEGQVKDTVTAPDASLSSSVPVAGGATADGMTAPPPADNPFAS
jgi:hypothetical protein